MQCPRTVPRTCTCHVARLSTYRLQLTPTFGLRARRRAGALSRRARRHRRLPLAAVRGRAGLDARLRRRRSQPAARASSAAKRATRRCARDRARRGMGQLVDFVPNHMGIGPHESVVDATCSRTARPRSTRRYFDIDWKPVKDELENKVLVPVLGDQYGEVLERGELRARARGRRLPRQYCEHRFPVAPRAGAAHSSAIASTSCAPSSAPSDVHLQELAEHPHRAREAGAARRGRRRTQGRRARARKRGGQAPPGRAVRGEPAHRARSSTRTCASSTARPAIRAASICSTELLDTPGLSARALARRRRGDQLPPLLRHQLARRHPHGGRARLRRHAPARLPPDRRGQGHRPAHRSPRRAVHAVGLLPPPAAARATGSTSSSRRSSKATRRCRPSWHVDGTTGYELLNAVNGLFVDAAPRRARFDELYARFTGDRAATGGDWSTRRSACSCARRWRREIHMLAHRLNRLSESNRRTRDFTLNALDQRAHRVRGAAADLPHLRRGQRPASVDERDRAATSSRPSRARQARLARARPTRSTTFCATLLLLETRDRRRRVEFVRKLQQVTGPVTAKAIEDTAFYVYNRLVSLNEVGGDPRRFGVSARGVPRATAARARPLARLAQRHLDARHQARRGRARCASTRCRRSPSSGSSALQRWAQLNGRAQDHRGRRARARRQRRAAGLPDAGRQLSRRRAMTRRAIATRIGGYLDKALKEAKVHSSLDQSRRDVREGDARLRRARCRRRRRSSPTSCRSCGASAAAARLSSLAQVALK